jgi:4-amino-4-deoxy-L-arabinose transferase-like glycosyltransferase
VRSRRGRFVGALSLPWSRLAARLGVDVRELACLAGIILGGAALRFVNLPGRGGWDSDQGTSMLDLRWASSTGQVPTFGPLSSLMTFHHGALYYDLMMPATWLGNGDPVWVVAEIALLSLLVIPAVWWIARTIGGSAAGLTAALLAATSASLISYATFIWNPTVVEPGAAVAYLGAWQAIRTKRAAWWLVAAVGGAVVAQAHIAAAFILLPLGAAFVVDLSRGPATRCRNVLIYGLVGVAIFVATYLPFIVWELGHNFTETRGILAYFSTPGSPASQGPLVRVVVAAIRILAWPLTRWPQIDLRPAFPVAFVVASATFMGLVWRHGVASGWNKRKPTPQPGATDPEATEPAPPQADGDVGLAFERLGVRLIGGWLVLLILALGLGLRDVSQVQELPTEQYHVIVDPLVLVAVGLIVGGLWRVLPGRSLTIARRGTAVVFLAALLVWNAGHWPPLTAYDGGWPSAQAAANRIERDAAGSSVAFVPLFALKGSDAYLYPLTRDGGSIATAEMATTIVVLCDTFWTPGCGGSAEEAWRAQSGSRTLIQIDRFAAAPDRILTVYQKAP